MAQSGIQWTDHTCNPTHIKGSRANYCVKISPGCKHCYAEKMSKRLAAISGDRGYVLYKHYEVPPEMELSLDRILSYKTKKKPLKIFVGSMTDIFMEIIPSACIFQMLDAMRKCSQHTWQILTKRADRMRIEVDNYCKYHSLDTLPDHIWCGVSVEDDNYASQRIPYLIATRAAVTFLSMEPLLEFVNPFKIPGAEKINWILIGGESGGLNARHFATQWAEHIIAIRDANYPDTAIFVKQMGSPWARSNKSSESHGGNMEDWPIQLRLREFPQIAPRAKN